MTYLFDIGNVLLAFDFMPALQKLTGENSKLNAIPLLMKKKDELESGKLSATSFMVIARELLDYNGSDSQFIETWNSIFTKIPANFELAKSLKKKGHRLILFSNISSLHARHCLDKYQLDKIFDHAVFSYEIGAIKPADAYFTRAFEKFNIDPQQSIYIDDMLENITAGKKHGLKSFCYDYNKHQDLLTWLDDQTSNQ